MLCLLILMMMAGLIFMSASSGHMSTGNRKNKFTSIIIISLLQNLQLNMVWIFLLILHRFLFLIMIWMAISIVL